MPTSYPTTMDVFPDTHQDNVGERIHASTVNDLVDAVLALERETLPGGGLYGRITFNPMTAQDDLIVGGSVSGGQAAPARLPKGASGQVLTVDAISGHVTWATPTTASGGMTNPMLASQDLIVGGAAGAPGRLPKGTGGQVLTVDVATGNLLWATPATPGMANPMTASQDLIVGGTAGAPGRLAKGTSGQVLTVDPTTGNLLWATPAAAGMANPMIAQDDIIIGGAAGAPVRLTKGTSGQVLTVDPATLHLIWATPATGSMANPMTTAGDLIYGGTVTAGVAAPTRLAIGSATQRLGGGTSAPAWGTSIPAIAGATPAANGDVQFDTTALRYRAYGAGAVVGTLGRGLFAGWSTTDTKSDTVTTEQTFATNFAIPASYLIANRVIEVLIGLSLTTAAAPPTFQFRLKLGTTTVFSTYALAPTANAPATQGLGFHVAIQGTAAAGASVNVVASMFGNYAGGSAFGFNSQAQPVAVATNAAQTLQVSVQFGTVGTGANSATLQQLIVREVN